MSPILYKYEINMTETSSLDSQCTVLKQCSTHQVLIETFAAEVVGSTYDVLALFYKTKKPLSQIAESTRLRTNANAAALEMSDFGGVLRTKEDKQAETRFQRPAAEPHLVSPCHCTVLITTNLSSPSLQGRTKPSRPRLRRGDDIACICQALPGIRG